MGRGHLGTGAFGPSAEGVGSIPEIMPFVVFALSGGTVPLAIGVLQILAIDLGTDTLPALAPGREPAEPGIMAGLATGKKA